MSGDTYNMFLKTTPTTTKEITMKQQSLIEWIENEEIAVKVERKLTRIDRYLLAALGCKRIAPQKQ